jgi:mxaA protein
MPTRRWLALALVLASAAVSAESLDAVMEPVRLYGYVIGDPIELHARVPVPSGYALDADRLPKAGRVNAFLELRSVEPADEWLQRYRRAESGARLSLRFLVVNSSTQVRSVQTPVLVLTYRREGAPDVAARIPQVELTVSPLTLEYVAGTAGLGEMQADAPPPRIPTAGPELRLLLYALLALMLCSYVAWRQGWVPRRLLAGRPFARAAQDIRRVREDTAAQSQAARAQRLHRAFDESAGFTVASHSLEQFFAAQPWSAALEAQIRDFFTRSARFFYAGEGSAMLPPADVARLARELAACEPRGGGA